ncbi:hypothetical protein BT63DRAFT_464036 [Microthyrium microscopicum]|uniref:Uncharacterized protein n=1 Tax=Microthyrium microscopicum TaxID=703497 RepID=A0A6A6U353_9PEZI|nr:hypothetical protein BT63DRAFT_464036 [Microthyrium microscopicum]
MTWPGVRLQTPKNKSPRLRSLMTYLKRFITTEDQRDQHQPNLNVILGADDSLIRLEQFAVLVDEKIQGVHRTLASWRIFHEKDTDSWNSRQKLRRDGKITKKLYLIYTQLIIDHQGTTRREITQSLQDLSINLSKLRGSIPISAYRGLCVAREQIFDRTRPNDPHKFTAESRKHFHISIAVMREELGVKLTAVSLLRGCRSAITVPPWNQLSWVAIVVPWISCNLMESTNSTNKPLYHLTTKMYGFKTPLKFSSATRLMTAHNGHPGHFTKTKKQSEEAKLQVGFRLIF